MNSILERFIRINKYNIIKHSPDKETADKILDEMKQLESNRERQLVIDTIKIVKKYGIEPFALTTYAVLNMTEELAELMSQNMD